MMKLLSLVIFLIHTASFAAETAKITCPRLAPNSQRTMSGNRSTTWDVVSKYDYYEAKSIKFTQTSDSAVIVCDYLAPANSKIGFSYKKQVNFDVNSYNKNICASSTMIKPGCRVEGTAVVCDCLKPAQ
jgi:hypothetical protein